MRDIMNAAWVFVKNNGMTLAEALRCAWCNFKVRKAMAGRVVKFYYMKIDGSIREAYGTLDPHRAPETQGARRPAPTVQVYYDTEKAAWRCFKKANLLRMA